MQAFVFGHAQTLDQHAGDIGGDVLATLCDCPDGLNQFSRIACFVQIALGACAQAPYRVLVFRKHGHNQDLDRRTRLAQA